MRRACPMTDPAESISRPGVRARKPMVSRASAAGARRGPVVACALRRSRWHRSPGRPLRTQGRCGRADGGAGCATQSGGQARIERADTGRVLGGMAAALPRHPRTQATNTERIRHYLLPLLPERGEVPLDELRRADLRDVQDALLRRRLAKSTIDGAFSALSAMLRDAVDIELIDGNPAARLRVRPADPRLNPGRGPVRRRAVPPDEIRAFMAQVTPSQRGCCWAPVMTGCRPGSCSRCTPRRSTTRPRRSTCTRRLIATGGDAGLKGSHHVSDREKRGRWTLFPAQLGDLVEAADDGYFSARRAGSSGRSATSTAMYGRRRRSGLAWRSRSTTCATRSRRGCWRQGFPWSRSRLGWGTRSAPAAMRSSTPPPASTHTRPASTASRRSASSPSSSTWVLPRLTAIALESVGPTLHTGPLWTAEPRPLSHLYGTDAAPAADCRGLLRRAKGDANVTPRTTNSPICRHFLSRTPALSRRRSRVPVPSLPPRGIARAAPNSAPRGPRPREWSRPGAPLVQLVTTRRLRESAGSDS